MFLKSATLDRVKTVRSASTREPVRVRLAALSHTNPKFDIFVNISTGKIVWRDSLRRRYTEV